MHFQSDGLPEGSSYDSRYGSLALLAWFLRRWPDGAGSAVAIDLLERWSSAKRNRVSRHLGVPDWNDAWNPGRTRSNPPFKRGFGNCWSLLVRGEGSDSADQRTGFDSESGPNTTGNGTCRFLYYEVSGDALW